MDFKPLYEYIQKERIPLLGSIPFKKEYAMTYSQGDILPEKNDELRDEFIRIIKKYAS
ncbi:MAG: hypothetical protein HC906_13400 [Bacteroidales bacterium]|nr:hypothetical protein [Bacteroidales bacterium]